MRLRPIAAVLVALAGTWSCSSSDATSTSTPDAGSPVDGGGHEDGTSVLPANPPNPPPPPATDGGVDAADGSYATTFPLTENPLDESGVWTNGGTVGLDWQNIRTSSHHAYASATSAGYDDCIAHLSGFPANHFAEATVHVAAGYNAPDSHEIELLVRFKITAHSARGYEINCGWNGAYSQIVRWNGPINDFTYLSPTGPGFGALAEGDVIRATAIGSTITVYKNGAQVMQVTDATWSDGNPGMAMFVRPNGAAVPESYCLSAYSAGSL